MLRLIAGALVLVPALAVIALALILDDAPPSGGPGLASGRASAPGGGARGIVNVQATIELPPAFPRRYLNIDLDAERTMQGGLPSIRRAAVGTVDVSGWLAERTIHWASDRWPVLKEERLERAVARALEWYPDRLELVCAWPRSPVEHLRVRAPSGDGAGGGGGGTGAYAERIADWAAAGPGSVAPALGLLRSLVREAAERTAAGADPVAENRTAILLAAAQGFGCSPVAVGRTVRHVRPVLHRRRDLGRHFVGSAALAALLGREASESVGMEKEVSDSREITGFSLSDLAANLAGARFGDLATASARSARRVQEWMEQAASDVDIMPEVRGLPDHLPEEELRRRFGEPGEGAYKRVLREIEARIADVPLYRVSK